MLSESDKRMLLKIAREIIGARLNNLLLPEFNVKSPNLLKKSGAFVTLYIKNNLRGCIGNIFETKPLHRVVKEMAISSAFRDPRFPPLTKEEFPETEIEISVLYQLETIKNVKEIEVGKHGIVIKQGWNSGLLLPQVAIKNNWDSARFLEEACQKAGLPKEAYKDHFTTIHTFKAEVFCEKDFS